MLAVLMTSENIQIKNISAGITLLDPLLCRMLDSLRFDFFILITNDVVLSGTFLLTGLANPFAQEQDWNQGVRFLPCQRVKE